MIVTLDDGTNWRTYTRSDPWQTSDGTWLISLKGKAGGYRLDRVFLDLSSEDRKNDQRLPAADRANFILLITGSRRFFNRDLFRQRVMHARYGKRFGRFNGGPLFVHGGAPGTDNLADHLARTYRCPLEVFYADWDAEPKRGGILRNADMVTWCKAQKLPVLTIGFPCPDSVGTWDCLRRAHKAGFTFRVCPVRPADLKQKEKL